MSTTVGVVQYLQISEYGIVAAAALLTFDYCLTLEHEVKWLYGTKWTMTRIHFTSSRYLPFAAIAMAIPTSLVRLGAELGTDYCGSLGTATNVVYYICIVLAEAMLIVRTYASWKRDRRILIGMCTFFLVCMLVAIVTSETIASSPTNSVDKSLNCIGAESTVATALQYIFLIIFELGMLGLNCIPFWRMTRARHNSPGRLIVTLYRDTIVYITIILAFSVINAVVTLTTPVQYSDIFNSPQMVLHSILVSRIFFNLRETNRQEERNTLSVSLTDFRAISQVSSGSRSFFGGSSSGGRNDPGTIDTGQVIDISGETTAQALVIETVG